MKKIKDIIVNENKTMKETMRVIDKNAINTAIIVNEKEELVGMVTDGDIRRALINGIELNESVSKIMNKNPKYGCITDHPEKIIQTIKEHEILGAPLVDKDHKIVDYIMFSKGNETYSFNETKDFRKKIKKVLVIGGGGFIGSVLTQQLILKNYEVVLLDKFLYGKESLKLLDSPNIKIIEGDTRHIEDLIEAMKDVDAVVHLAELVGDPACELNPSNTHGTNYFATKLIASICKHLQINRLIYTSSCSVYGASESEELLTENSQLNPVSLYAKMKIESEKALIEMKDDNFLPTILRLSTVFGSSPRLRFDLVLNLLTAKAVKDKKITIFGGDQWRPNVHVLDVARTIIKILESPIDSVGGEIFNVGSEINNLKINELGTLINKEIPEAEIVIEDKKMDKRNYKVDFSKLREILNLEIKTSVEEGIKEIKKLMIDSPDLDYNKNEYSNIKFLENN